MALLKYFAKSKSLPDPNGPLSSKLKPETIDMKYFAKSKSLPDPNGPLSSKLKPETIDSANRKVSALLASTGSSSAKDDGSGQRSRGSYMKFTPEQKAQVARYALESGNKRAIVKYSKQWGVDLKESTVRTWKTKYTEGLRKRKPTEPLPIKALPDRKTRTTTAAWRRTGHSSAGLCGEHTKTRRRCKHCHRSRRR